MLPPLSGLWHHAGTVEDPGSSRVVQSIHESLADTKNLHTSADLALETVIHDPRGIDFVVPKS